MKDFFKSYHTQKVRTYMRSSVIALALAFPIAGLIHQSSPQGMILANVLEAGSTEVVEYSADFLVKQEGSTLSFILGKDAYDVDTLSFSLLGDPERFLSLQSNDPSVSIVSNEPGVALVKITKNRSALKK